MINKLKPDPDNPYQKNVPNEILIVREHKYCNHSRKLKPVCSLKCRFYRFDEYAQCLLALADGVDITRKDIDDSKDWEYRQLCHPSCPGSGRYVFKKVMIDGRQLFDLKRVGELEDENATEKS